MFEGTVTVFDCGDRQNPKFPQNISTPAEVSKLLRCASPGNYR
jgi:hypothetical protein